MAKSSGSDAQFTYDFGIAVAQSTVNKLVKLTGATVTLASAFYSLQQVSKEYVSTLKTNAIQFGGQLKTIAAMEKAQRNLLAGVTAFSVKDQLQGMEALRRVGVDVQKDFKFFSDAAKATQQSFSEFSGAVAQGISGNMGGLVQMGLLTERAVRMFEKYPANTIQRQAAIMKFVKEHKGLQSVIKNDFETIQNQMMRLRENWTLFVQTIMGKPNDPNSFYGQITQTVKSLADSFVRNGKLIKQWGFAIGQVLGFVVRTVGQVVRWTGRQVKKVLESLWKTTDGYKEQVYSFVVWLEFWKVKIVKFFNEYSGAIKGVIKLLIMYKLLSTAFTVTAAAITGVKLLCTWWTTARALQLRYLAATGSSRAMSWAAFMPKGLRSFWIGMGKIFANVGDYIFLMGVKLKPVFAGVGRFMTMFLKSPLKGLAALMKMLVRLPALLAAGAKGAYAMVVAFAASNPVGWVLLVIAALGVLYWRVKGFRDLVNKFFMWWLNNIKLGVSILWEGLKLVWNLIVWVWVKFKQIFSLVGRIWGMFKDTGVGRAISKIIDPLQKVFEFIWGVVKDIAKIFTNTLGWVWRKLSGANTAIAKDIARISEKEGYKTKGVEGADKPLWGADTYANPASPKPVANPLIVPQTTSTMPESSDEYTATGQLTFGQGSVVINVMKGENIDEEKLKRIILKAIDEIERNATNRGGK